MAAERMPILFSSGTSVFDTSTAAAGCSTGGAAARALLSILLLGLLASPAVRGVIILTGVLLVFLDLLGFDDIQRHLEKQILFGSWMRTVIGTANMLG